MSYDLDYKEIKESIDELVNKWHSDTISGVDVEETFTSFYKEDELEEAERLNIILAITEWQVENDELTEWMKDKLYLYYQDYIDGKLDGIFGHDEETVVKLLATLYKKVYPEEA